MNLLGKIQDKDLQLTDQIDIEDEQATNVHTTSSNGSD